METSVGWRKRVLATMERVAATCSTSVVVISESLRSRAIELRLVPAAKARVLGSGSSNGVDLDSFDPARYSVAEVENLRRELGLAPEATTIGYVGRLTRDKGLFDLVDAARLVNENGTPLQLLIVGGVDDESGRAAVKALESLQIPVALAGHVTDPAIYFALMDIFCLPSHREGFGNVVIEASAMEVPVIASRATGIVDAVVDGQTGILVPVSSPPMLAGAIDRLIRSPEVAHRMGKTGREWVRVNFDRQTVQTLYADDLDAEIGAIKSIAPVGDRP